MKGTHSLKELQNTQGFTMFKSGIVLTKYGRYTLNYWVLTDNNLYKNYDCKTIY